MSRLPLPREYILAMLNYFDKELNRMPQCSIISHSGQDKVLVRNPRHEYGINTPKGRELLHIQDKRNTILRLKRQITEQWNRAYHGVLDRESISLNCEAVLPGSDIWNEIVTDTNPYKKKEELYHNGIKVRSRMEMMISEVLDQLGLEYLYEPEIVLDGKRIYPDFVVRIPAFGCCIIIEYLGMLDDYKYLDATKNKLGVYLRNGFYPGTNLILLGGSKNSAPTIDAIYNSIVAAIASLCDICVTT